MRPMMPDYGTFPWWPEGGEAWIHPDDVATARKLIPSERVFRREKFDGEYDHLVYGEYRIRIRPTMWLPVPGEPIELGDKVEVLSDFGRVEPFIGLVKEKLFQRAQSRLVYIVRRVDFDSHLLYTADQLRLLVEKVQLKPHEMGKTIAEPATSEPEIPLEPAVEMPKKWEFEGEIPEMDV